MKLKEIAAHVNQFIPQTLAQDWDNTGLLIGDRERDIKNILLTIDITKPVLAEALKSKTDLIISYHPVIWDGLKHITADGPESIVYELIRSGIAVYSIHTALDVLEGGVNDALAEIIGLKDPSPIGDYVQPPRKQNFKLVIYVPADSLNHLRQALFNAGAGHIGNYSQCSFHTTGEGSFLPHEGARPAIGKINRLEKVDEARLETIIPQQNLPAVIDALKTAHPYETPAYDIFAIHDPAPLLGLGRIGLLAKPEKLDTLLEKIQKATGAKAAGLVAPKNTLIRKAAVCAGSCSQLINAVIAQKADLYLTGELKHHHALAAQHANLTCVCLTHSVSERFILKKLASQLQKKLKNVKITISKKDKDPFQWKMI